MNRPPRRCMAIARTAAAVLLAGLLHAAPALSKDGAVPAEVGADTDPTKPVFVTLRNEYFDLRDDAWQNAVVLRADRLALPWVKLPGNSHGFLLRADLPYVTLHRGTTTKSGLGDFYAQSLVVPSPVHGYTFVWGTGVVLPTAASGLGAGKWQVAPAVAPAKFFGRRRGFAFVKVQDFLSFAGDEARPDINYLLVTPTMLLRVSRSWWIVADSESKTNWKNQNLTSYRSGFQVGKMFSSRFGLWTKLEVPWGPNRLGDWTARVSGMRTRY